MPWWVDVVWWSAVMCDVCLTVWSLRWVELVVYCAVQRQCRWTWVHCFTALLQYWAELLTTRQTALLQTVNWSHVDRIGRYGTALLVSTAVHWLVSDLWRILLVHCSILVIFIETVLVCVVLYQNCWQQLIVNEVVTCSASYHSWLTASSFDHALLSVGLIVTENVESSVVFQLLYYTWAIQIFVWVRAVEMWIIAVLNDCCLGHVISARQRICLARYMLSPVRPSVRPSDRVYHRKTVEVRIMKFSPSL